MSTLGSGRRTSLHSALAFPMRVTGNRNSGLRTMTISWRGFGNCLVFRPRAQLLRHRSEDIGVANSKQREDTPAHGAKIRLCYGWLRRRATLMRLDQRCWLAALSSKGTVRQIHRSLLL